MSNLRDFPADLPADDDPEEGYAVGRTLNNSKVELRGKDLLEANLRFAQLLFAGHDQARAFVLAGLVGEMTYGSDNSLRASAAKYAERPEIVAELERLRERTRRLMEEQAIYETQHAMSEANTAYNLALSRGDAKAAVQAIFLKAKLRGLLVEDRKNERTPLKDLSKHELDKLITDLAGDIKTLEGVAERVAEEEPAPEIPQLPTGEQPVGPENSSGQGARGTETPSP